jgi:2-dehydro-3-deoxyglucarate aldolase
MNRQKKINSIRKALRSNQISIGSWMQIPHASIAEIMGQAGYDWVAVDMEHGSISVSQLPDLFRALELGETLPLVRLAQGQAKDCKQAFDAGAGGVIVPNVETAAQLKAIRNACCWPPAGGRGVGFSRANLFGKNFKSYSHEAQSPFLVAMIESSKAVESLDEILAVKGLDAILVGPYDLSASLGVIGQFDSPIFLDYMDRIRSLCLKGGIPCGLHIVMPDIDALQDGIKNGYRFFAYSIDAVFINSSCLRPLDD